MWLPKKRVQVSNPAPPNRKEEDMKKIAEFLIPNYEDRSNLLAILGTAGYLVKLEARKNQTRHRDDYYVVVYKEDTDGQD